MCGLHLNIRHLFVGKATRGIVSLTKPVKRPQIYHQLLHDRILDKTVDIVQRYFVLTDLQLLFENVEVAVNIQLAINQGDILRVILCKSCYHLPSLFMLISISFPARMLGILIKQWKNPCENTFRRDCVS